jgi:putative thioredoxin
MTTEEDVSEANFAQVVLAGSSERPVVVDFWAPWCGPCRVLGPVLEAEVQALGGKVKMVKLNTDENPSLAMEYGIQGIPAVKAFRDGKVVSEFVGARTAAFVRSWLAPLAPSEGAQGLARATAALQAGRSEEAEAALRPLVDDPEVRDQARVLLARLLLGLGRLDEVRGPITGIDPRSAASSAVPSIETMLTLADEARTAGGEKAARAALTATPNDLAARYTLASALVARGEYAGALENFLEVVSRNRKLKDDGARLAMLAIFEQLGNESPLTQDYRRRLQIVL